MKRKRESDVDWGVINTLIDCARNIERVSARITCGNQLMYLFIYWAYKNHFQLKFVF